MNLSVVIADDELLARKRLQRLLGAMPDVEVLGECESGEQVLQLLRTQKPEVLLLDIHMPGLSGIEAVQLLPSDGPHVIFCTAHADHAVTAFEQGAVDYLLKPIEAPRLRKALERARNRRNVPKPGTEKLKRIPVTTRQGIVLVDPTAVTHAVLDGELVTVHTEKQSYLTDLTLQALSELLPPETFERVHRRAILNLSAVARLEPLETGGYIARTHKGDPVEVSRQSARSLRKRLGLRKAADDAE